MTPTIIQGTTPTHSFTLPFNPALAKTVRFVYAQDDQVKIRKETEDVVIDLETGEVSATLTQEDTYKLEPGVVVELRLRVLDEGDGALVSETEWLLCEGIADKEVLV